MLRDAVAVIGILAVLPVVGYPQAAVGAADAGIHQSGNGLSVRSELEKYGIPMTHSALVEALNGEHSDRRSLAAAGLVEINDPEAGSLIRSALSAEKEPVTRIHMATELLSIGDRSGAPVLESMCQSKELDGAFRLMSAQALLSFHIESSICLSGVLEMVTATEDTELREDGIFVLGRYRNLNPESALNVRKLQVAFLKDPNRLVRIRAAESISMSGDVSFLPILRDRLRSETDDRTKNALSAAISRLAKLTNE